jgi:hypothetical protein
MTRGITVDQVCDDIAADLNEWKSKHPVRFAEHELGLSVIKSSTAGPDRGR